MHTTGTIKVGQNQIFYQSEGRGKALFLIHGGGVDHEMWAPQVTHFAQQYQVITYDIRGHGQSTFVDNELPDAADILAILDTLGVKQVQLVGLSLGAVLAVDFCLAYPARVQRLLLLSPGLVGVQEKEPSYQKPISQLGEAIQAQRFDVAIAVIQKWTFQGRRSSIPQGLEAEQAYLAAGFRRYLESGNFIRLPHLIFPEPLVQLSKIQCPTLILYGEWDLPYMETNVRMLASGIPDSQLQCMVDTAHLINAERPKEVNRAMTRFLKA